jgi:hypothetical protein
VAVSGPKKGVVRSVVGCAAETTTYIVPTVGTLAACPRGEWKNRRPFHRLHAIPDFAFSRTVSRRRPGVARAGFIVRKAYRDASCDDGALGGRDLSRWRAPYASEA